VFTELLSSNALIKRYNIKTDLKKLQYDDTNFMCCSCFCGGVGVGSDGGGGGCRGVGVGVDAGA
jgi:hypothetical protein